MAHKPSSSSRIISTSSVAWNRQDNCNHITTECSQKESCHNKYSCFYLQYKLFMVGWHFRPVTLLTDHTEAKGCLRCKPATFSRFDKLALIDTIENDLWVLLASDDLTSNSMQFLMYLLFMPKAGLGLSSMIT